MQHTNTMAIRILSEEFEDYEESPSKYDAQYKTLVTSINLLNDSTVLIKRERLINILIAWGIFAVLMVGYVILRSYFE